MKPHPARRIWWVRSFTITCLLACPAVDGPFAAELAREIPVARDRGGSEVKVEITREGARQSAVPTASLAEPTFDRITGQIEKRTGLDLRQGDSPAKAPAGVADGEITARDAKMLLRTLRDRIRGKGAHAVHPPASPELPAADHATVSAERPTITEGSSAAPAGRN